MNMPSSGKPTQDDLQRLAVRLQPKILRLFQRHEVSRETAELLLTAALTRLLYRWDRVRDRERWLLSALRKGLAASREAISKGAQG